MRWTLHKPKKGTVPLAGYGPFYRYPGRVSGIGGNVADFDTGDVVRLGCVQRYLGRSDIVNVLHLKIVSGGGLAFAAAAQDFQEYCDALFDTIKTLVPTAQIPVHISVQNVTQTTVWGAIAWNVYAGGTSASGVLAAQTSMLVFGRTAISRVQIRKYLGVFTEPNLTSGEWTTTARSVAQAFIDYHVVQKTMTNGLVLQGVAYNPPLARSTVAITGTTSAVPVTQRRRRLDRGA